MAAVYALFFISALTARAMLAGAAAHPAKVECSAATTELMECLSFVSSGSKATKPSESCCTAVSTVAKKTPECLCAVAQEAPGLGFPLNLTRVRELPHECKVPMPDEGNCSAPGLRPAPSPIPSPKRAPVSPALPVVPPPKAAASPVSSARSAPEPAVGGSTALSSSLMVLLISLTAANLFN